MVLEAARAHHARGGNRIETNECVIPSRHDVPTAYVMYVIRSYDAAMLSCGGRGPRFAPTAQAPRSPGKRGYLPLLTSTVIVPGRKVKTGWVGCGSHHPNSNM